MVERAIGTASDVGAIAVLRVTELIFDKQTRLGDQVRNQDDLHRM